MRVIKIFLVSVVALSACVTPGPRVPAPATVADGLNLNLNDADRRRVEELAVQLIQADTSNPPGNEAAAVAVLKKFFDEEGVSNTVYAVPGMPGRPVLIAKVLPKRQHKRPVVLLAHTDVVPADGGEWTNGVLPFSGRTQDGYLWGRGALDMKGMLAAEAMAMVIAHRKFVNSKDYKLERALFLVATPDEENGGSGAKWVAENMEKLFGDKPEFMLNEGGIGVKGLLFPEQDMWAVSVAERGHLWLDVRVERASGHASQPWVGHAIQELVAGIERLRAAPFAVQLLPSTREMLRRAATGAPWWKAFMMRRGWLAGGALTAKQASNGSVRHTCIETSLTAGGPRPNVIPAEATAVLDCRLLPGTDPETVRPLVVERMAIDGAVVKVRSAQSGTRSPWTSTLFGALERHLKRGPKDVVVPIVSPGTTDSSYFRKAGVDFVYGIVPFMVALDDLRGIHGADERVRLTELHAGAERLVKVIADIAAVARPKFTE
jgi:acetylornithine deacetylase/succinyl-diaminopimelate desuccinylase-like protein